MSYIDQCLESVLSTKYLNFEVIFIDNCSIDGSLEYVKQKFSNDYRLRISVNDKNYGFSEGNNRGIKLARGKYIIFLNNDTMVESTWLQELIIVMEANKKIGAAQSKLLVLNNPERIFDSTGDFIDFYGTPLRRAAGEKDLGQYEYIEEVFSARGACIIVRHNVLKEVGGFDPAFVLGYEDIDLCWRIRLRGYKVVYIPRSVVFHRGYGTNSYLRNVRRDPVPLLMIKNYDIFNLLLYLSPNLVITSGAFVLDVFLRRNLSLALSRFNAIRWVMFNLQAILVKRYIVQHVIRRVTDKEVKKMMLQSNLALYTRFILEGHRVSYNPRHLKNIISSYFIITNPHKFDS